MTDAMKEISGVNNVNALNELKARRELALADLVSRRFFFSELL